MSINMWYFRKTHAIFTIIILHGRPIQIVYLSMYCFIFVLSPYFVVCFDKLWLYCFIFLLVVKEITLKLFLQFVMLYSYLESHSCVSTTTGSVTRYRFEDGYYWNFGWWERSQWFCGGFVSDVRITGFLHCYL